MSEILGHDIDGRPLRAGDRVKLIDASNEKFKPDIGRVFTIKCKCTTHVGALQCLETMSFGAVSGRYALGVEHLRRIDDRPDLSTWGDVAKQTGWNPSRVREGV